MTLSSAGFSPDALSGFEFLTLCREQSAVSVNHAAKRSESLPRQRIPRLDFERFLETSHGAAVHFFAQIRAAEIVVRKMARLIASRFSRAFEPGNRVVKTPQLDEIGSDVVVGIAEFRINFDRPFALRDGVFDAALKMIGPAKKRVRFRRRVQLERRLIEFDGPIVVAFHLGLIRVLKDFPGSCEGFLAHGLELTHGLGKVKSTRVPSVRGGNLYFVPGARSGNYADKKRR